MVRAILNEKAPANASIGVTSTAVVPANKNRAGLKLINDSPNKIYLAFGFPAELLKGTPLNADGGSYEMNETNLSLQSVNAISGTASSNLSVQEADVLPPHSR